MSIEELMEEKGLTRAQAAEYLTKVMGLPTTKGQLQKQASQGRGPPYDIWGNKAIYKPTGLRRHAASVIRPGRVTPKSL
jgi:hypothetical protein